MNTRRFLQTLAIAMALSLVTRVPARAALIATDNFADNVGSLSGQGGGFGWSGAWVTGQSTVFQVQSGSLSGGMGPSGGSLLFYGANAVSGTGARVFRALDLSPGSAAASAGLVENTATRFNGTQAALGKPGTTVWLGVLFHPGTAGNGVAGSQYLDQVHLYNGATTTASALSQGDNNKDGEALAIGRGNGNTAWNFERTCAHDLCPNGATSSAGFVSAVTMDSVTHWVVMRFVFVSSTTTQITTWLDPAPGASDPTDASALVLNGQQLVNVTGLHFSWIELGGQTSRFLFDEVRLATTFAEISSNATLAVFSPGASPAIRVGATPNPFQSTTQVWFALPVAEHVTLRAFDLSGREVRTLADGDFGAGGHALGWDGRDDHGAAVRGGVYFLRLASHDGIAAATALRLP